MFESIYSQTQYAHSIYTYLEAFTKYIVYRKILFKHLMFQPEN